MNNTQPTYDIQTDLNSLWKWSVIGTAVGLFLGSLMVFIAWLRVGKTWPEPGAENSTFFWCSILFIILTFLPIIAYLSVKFENKNKPNYIFISFICLYSMLPYSMFLFCGYLSNPGGWAGFFHYDHPYYLANGRAIFSRGNGLFYPNPYDPSVDSPAIYFHWLIWVYGFCLSKLGLSVAKFSLFNWIVSSFCLSFFTWMTIRELTKNPVLRVSVFFMVMWGGSILYLSKVFGILIHSQFLKGIIASVENKWGWCFTWGSNLNYPTESIYHSLVIFSWWSAIRNRWSLATMSIILLAATHPWSGLQHLLILSVFWFVFLVLLGKDGRDFAKKNLGSIFATLIALGIFLWYYMIFLNQFESHRRIYNDWKLEWFLPLGTLLLVDGIPFLFALPRITQGLLASFGLRESSQKFQGWEILLLLTSLITLFLSKHELFLENHRQPIHFHRGYLGTPLLLLSIGTLERLFAKLTSKVLLFTAIFIILIASIDNIRSITYKISIIQKDSCDLSRSEVEVLRWLDLGNDDGLVLTETAKQGYLIPVYTKLRTFYGHKYNTPQYNVRMQKATLFFKQGQYPELLDEVDFLLCSQLPPQLSQEPRLNQFEVVFSSGKWTLMKKTPQPSKPSPPAQSP